MTSLYICHSSEFCTLEDTAHLCKSNGFGIELSDFSNMMLLSNTNRIQTIAGCIDQIPERAMHGPYLGMDAVSEDAAVSDSTIKCFNEVYNTAHCLNVRHIILHPAFNPLVFSPQIWLRRAVSFWEAYLKDKSPDIRFHLENVMDADPEILYALVSEVNRPNLDINLDIGHVHAYAKTPLLKWISSLGPKIGYVHLHDNHGQIDEHIGLGEGNLPLKEAFQSLQYYAPAAIWSIESGGIGRTQSLAWLYQHGFIEQAL